MWIRKIKRKKLQFFLIGVILYFAAAIFSGCLLFSTENATYINNYYSRSNNYDAFALINSKDSIKMLADKAAQDSGIKGTYYVDGIKVSNNYKINGKITSAFYFIISKIGNYKDLPWETSIYKGVDSACPKDNELWVSKVFSESNKLKIGDVLTINGKDLKVSAILKCALSPASTMSYSPVFSNEATYNELIKSNEYSGLFSVKSSKSIDYAYDFIKKTMAGHIQDVFMDFKLSSLVECIMPITVITGGIGLIAAIMIFVVSIVITKFIIGNNLIKEYRSIGIHKAIGDSNRTIKGYYIKAYLFVGFLAVTLGIASGIPLAYYMCRVNLSNLSNFHFSAAVIIVALISLLLLMLILTFSLYTSFKSINRITPANAIRTGVSSSKKKLKRSLIKNAHSPLTVAVNDIVKHKRASIMMIIMLTISFFLSIFITNMSYASTKIPEYSNKWFCVPKSDAVISGKIDDNTAAYVEKNSYVDSIVKGKLLTKFNFDYNKKLYDIDLKNISAVMYDNWSYDKTKIPFKEGHGPENKNEIAFSDKLINESSLKVGDYIEMSVNNFKNTFLISGSYTAMLNEGYSLALNTDIYNTLSPGKIQYDLLSVSLNNKEDYNAFKKDITAHLDNVVVDRIAKEIETASSSVVDIIKPVCLILTIVFVLFSLINIINLLALENLNNRRQFGILKSLGFTNKYICLKCFWKTMLLTLVSIILATTIYIISAKELFKSAVGIDSMVTSVPLTSVLIAIIFIAIVSITMMFCLPLRKITPKDLMEE